MILSSLFCAAAAAQGGALAVSLEPIFETDGLPAGGQTRMALAVTVPEGWHVNANQPLEDYLIPTKLTVEPLEGLTVAEVVYPEAKQAKFSFSETPLAVYEAKFYIGVLLKASEALAPSDYTLKLSLRYQACNDSQCRPPATVKSEAPLKVVPAGTTLALQHPEVFQSLKFGGAPDTTPAPSPSPAPAAETLRSTDTESVAQDWRSLADKFQVVGRAEGYLKTADFLAFLDSAETGTGAATAGMFEGKAFWLIILLTILGGLGLNLTPCVLPLIPINVAIIGAGTRAGSRARGFALGGAYGLGIALLYGGLGLVVVLTTQTFGALNASPWFNFAIAGIFVILALAMFDVFLIDFTRFQSKLGIKRKEGGSFAMAFFMGAVSALLAGACIAPAVIAVILFSRDLYAKGSVVGLMMPFLLGLGMAIPWPIVGAGLSMFPKPGRWMEAVKDIFGVIILGFAAYYGFLGAKLFNERYLVDREAVLASTQTMDAEGWTPSLAEGLARAQREGEPVIIDFWATWCKSCLTMNKTTFKDPAVTQRLENYVKIKYQAEIPDESPAKEVVEYFKVVGLPTYIVLKPGTGK